MKPTNKRFITRAVRSFILGLSFAVGLLSMALLAVAVSGTINTFSTGETLDAAKMNTNFASLKTAIEGIPSEKAWRLIYETDIATNTTSVNITGLNGDTDLEYEIIARFVSGTAAASVGYFIRPNGDSTTSNYIQRYVFIDNGANPSKGTDNNSNGLALCGALSNASGGICSGSSLVFAKSGVVRTTIGKAMYHSSTTSWFHYNHSSVYTISNTNITSLTIMSDQTNGIGAGSHIEIWARR